MFDPNQAMRSNSNINFGLVGEQSKIQKKL